MADGMCSHDGFFSLMFGHSSTVKGKLYNVSIFSEGKLTTGPLICACAET